jgi:hypothetical protein
VYASSETSHPQVERRVKLRLNQRLDRQPRDLAIDPDVLIGDVLSGDPSIELDDVRAVLRSYVLLGTLEMTPSGQLRRS